MRAGGIMSNFQIKKSLISIYVIFILITTGFVGLLIFNGVVEDLGVEAVTIRYVGGSGSGNYSTIQKANIYIIIVTIIS